MSIYDFVVKDIRGKDVSLSNYKGKALLIVNTASKCGFTPQFESLQKLYDEYHEKGFEVLGFPCNQFASQDPGTDLEIASFCSINYGVTFPMFSKIDVNGSAASPLFRFLRAQKSNILGDKIKWNFTKFLVDRSGNVVSRTAPMKDPSVLKATIEKLL